jgi:hypothetical protein
MSRTTISLKGRMRSSSVNPNERRRRTNEQDIAGGLGYNRDLIGAVQALCYRYGAIEFVPIR